MWIISSPHSVDFYWACWRFSSMTLHMWPRGTEKTRWIIVSCRVSCARWPMITRDWLSRGAMACTFCTYPFFFFLAPCAISSHYIDFCWSRCVMNTSWKKCPALIIKARSCAKWIISSIYFYRARYQIYFVEQCQQGLNPIRSTVLNFKPIF